MGFLGVKPTYQHTGVAAGLYIEHFDTAARRRRSGGEMGWILETNDAMNRAMEGMGGSLVKRYRVYEAVSRDRHGPTGPRVHSPLVPDQADSAEEPEAIDGELVPGPEDSEQVADVRRLPVPAEATPTGLDHRRGVTVPATVVAATGGFLLGVAAFLALRVLRRPGTARSSPAAEAGS